MVSVQRFGSIERVGRYACGIVLFASFAQPAYAANLLRGPYLQTLTPTSITIKWRTDDQTDAIVRYGTATNALNNSTSGTAVGVDHEVILSGLTPATRYYYSIGDSVETLAGGDSSFTFQTAPTPDTPQHTRIWVIGDSGTADSNSTAVRDGFIAFTGNAIFAFPFMRSADLWLMLGDNAYSDGTDFEYQAAVFDTYPMLLRQIPLWPTLGNHDGISADSGTESGPYYDIFSLPRNAEAGGLSSGTEAYYSFDYGNIHFITLDSHETDRSVGGAMLTWLNNDLAATTKEWIIGFWHHPPYTKGSHNSDTEVRSIDMRTRVLPILEAYGVDLVITGHSHSYERSFLMDGHYGTSDTFDSSMLVDDGSGREDDTGIYTKITSSAPNQGTVYAVAGSSGKLGGGSFDHPAMYISLRILGSMVLDIDGNRLDAVFIDRSGSVTDYFSFSKGEGQNIDDPPMFTSSPVTNATQGASYIYNVATTDPDSGDVLSITSAGLPGWLVLNDNGDGTATLSGTPTNADVGDHAISLRVTDASTASDVQNFTITVGNNVNQAPMFTSSPVTDATQDQLYTYNVMTADPDIGDALIITAPTLPSWLTFTGNGDGTATLSGTPDALDVLSNSDVKLQVADTANATDTQSFTITINNVNDAPVFTSPAVAGVTEGQEYLYLITTADPDFDPVTITATVLPAWLTLTDNGDGTGELRGVPAGADVGDHPVELQVQENTPTPGLAGSQQFMVTVTAASDGPVRTQSTGGGGGASLVELFALFILSLGGSITRRLLRANAIWA